MSTPAALYRRDAAAYLDELRRFCHEGVIEGEEYELLVWGVRSVSSAGDELVPLAAAGVFAARWETWRPDLHGPALGLFPGHRENEYRSYAELGIPDEFIDPVYLAHLIRVQLEEFAADPTLPDRLDLIYRDFVIGLVKDGERLDAKGREATRLFYELGIGVSLAYRRLQQQHEQGIEQEPYAAELVFLQSEPNPLADVALPAEVRGCTLALDDVRGYTLQAHGRLGGSAEIKFTAEGANANIWSISKNGKIGGHRQVKVPAPTLVEALRTLGFQEMTWPNGKRYRLSSWGGLSGIRPIRD